MGDRLGMSMTASVQDPQLNQASYPIQDPKPRQKQRPKPKEHEGPASGRIVGATGIYGLWSLCQDD